MESVQLIGPFIDKSSENVENSENSSAFKPVEYSLTQTPKDIPGLSTVSSVSPLAGTFLFRVELATDCCLTPAAFTGNLPSQILNLDYKTYQVKVIGPACYGLGWSLADSACVKKGNGIPRLKRGTW